MSPVLVTGTIVVNLALIAYSIGIFTEQRRRRISRLVVRSLTAGVVLDLVATGCMIVGSSRGPFTAHGLLGFSSLAAMLVETSLAWRHRLKHGEAVVPVWLHRYSRLAYGWWVVAYITGALLVMSSRA